MSTLIVTPVDNAHSARELANPVFIQIHRLD
jgi:hypothetical protein